MVCEAADAFYDEDDVDLTMMVKVMTPINKVAKRLYSMHIYTATMRLDSGEM